MRLEINPTWNYNSLLQHIRGLKSQYKGILASFSSFDIKHCILFRLRTRNQIYTLNVPYWKKDRVWEYLNDYETFDVLERLK